MTDDTKVFREKLGELSEYARQHGSRIETGRIREALDALELGDDKLQMVYAYLEQQGIEVYDPALFGEEGAAQRKSALERYLEELDTIAQLPQEMERAMFDQAADGDREARDTLLSHYLAAACDLAGQFQETDDKLDPEDLIQEANVGLILAMDALEKEDSLAAYRAKLINRVTEYLEGSIQEMKDARLGENRVLERMNALAKSVHELEEQLEHKPSIEEVSAYLDLTTQEIRDLLRMGGENLTIEDI